ncbi:MAG: MFS transporter, partial [Acidimicrobiia bacterium]|nr:MFS transporter [Acidimicrobiia bacterium]
MTVRSPSRRRGRSRTSSVVPCPGYRTTRSYGPRRLPGSSVVDRPPARPRHLRRSAHFAAAPFTPVPSSTMKGDHGFESEDEFRAEAEEAMVDGDRPLDVGPVRAALAVRDFRTMWLSTLGSTIGTWMQNVILAAFVYATTKSAWLVSLVGFCNLVPQLLFATFGGVIADMFDRKKLIIWLSLEQLLGSLAIAWICLLYTS